MRRAARRSGHGIYIMTSDYIQKTLATGDPIPIGWNDWGAHWQVIIGYDTMGTETKQDDVIIVADPVGWIVAMKDTITEETRKENSWRAMAVKIMEADVAVYNSYLTGEVYGYTLYKADLPADDTDTDSLVWEEIDSCYGFYGDDITENGMCGNVGCGLADAIARGEYEKGKTKLLLSAQVDVPTF